ncbi:MAG TPA: thiosulfate oxidation carrier protein SoxY [Thiobacillaceae bacterium]|nr:thiosulfate oxidation carrier protein SoxY [Thiobacillaceae bacterium]HNU63179.1 thiosulfate oxidation carrier protein SoxY [Thiobacillaceae bacterium]
MNNLRRSVLKGAGSAGVVGVAMMAGLLKPGMVFAAWNKAGFESKDMAGAMSSVGAGAAAASGDITVKAPDIAENGAVVPVEVESKIAGTNRLVLLSEKNIYPLLADFNLSNGAEPYVSTRIKLGATSNVVAVAYAGGKAYKAHKEVKVTIGGCGG